MGVVHRVLGSSGSRAISLSEAGASDYTRASTNAGRLSRSVGLEAPAYRKHFSIIFQKHLTSHIKVRILVRALMGTYINFQL